MYTYICLKCTQFLKINAGNSLSVTRELNIQQFLRFRLIVWKKCTAFKWVIIDEISALTVIYLIK